MPLTMKVTIHLTYYILRYIAVGILLLCIGMDSQAQFYNGSDIEFGKNRVQYELFEWKYYRFDKYETYFYTGGTELAEYTSKYVNKRIGDIENFLDYYLDEKIQFVVYNKHSDFKQ